MGNYLHAILGILLAPVVYVLYRGILSYREIFSKLQFLQSKLILLRKKNVQRHELKSNKKSRKNDDQDPAEFLSTVATNITKIKALSGAHLFVLSFKYGKILKHFISALEILESEIDAQIISLSNNSKAGKQSPPVRVVHTNKEDITDKEILEQEKALRKKYSRSTDQELYELGRNFMQGNGVEKDGLKAYILFKIAADNGNLSGKTGVAICYLHGQGVKQDMSKAVSDFEDLANQGHMKALVNLGICYYNGFGVKQNIKAAFSMWEQASKNGDAQAKSNLGSFYLSGLHVRKNPAKAVSLFGEASNEGNADGSYNLGRCYQYGVGTKKDLSKAVELYRKAADAHSVLALCTLAYCYDVGSGVKEDKTKALKMYESAAQKGSPFAKQRIEESILKKNKETYSGNKAAIGWVQDMPGDL